MRHTEVELKEKKHRIEDAVSATRAAIEEGIVAGGGSALVHAGSVLDDNLGLTGDEATVLRSSARPVASRCVGLPRTRASRRLRSWRTGCELGAETATTRQPMSTATC